MARYMMIVVCVVYGAFMTGMEQYENTQRKRLIPVGRDIVVKKSQIQHIQGSKNTKIEKKSHIDKLNDGGNVDINTHSYVGSLRNMGKVCVDKAKLGKIDNVGDVTARFSSFQNTATVVGCVALDEQCRAGSWYVYGGPIHIRDSSVDSVTLWNWVKTSSPLMTPIVDIYNSYINTIEIDSDYIKPPHVILNSPRNYYILVTFSRNAGYVLTSNPDTASVTNGRIISHASHTYQHDTCPICLDSFVSLYAMRSLPCYHLFHDACITQWLRTSQACPVCRSELA